MRQIDAVKWLISKYNLKRIRKSEHPGLSDEEVFAIYKSQEIVEAGFRALKSDMAIDHVYHSKDMRIETHTVMVVLGYLMMSVLRPILTP